MRDMLSRSEAREGDRTAERRGRSRRDSGQLIPRATEALMAKLPSQAAPPLLAVHSVALPLATTKASQLSQSPGQRLRSAAMVDARPFMAALF